MQLDLYHCEQGALPTIIARYGDDGPAYLLAPIASSTCSMKAFNVQRIEVCRVAND
jgi:hypothetical protein